MRYATGFVFFLSASIGLLLFAGPSASVRRIESVFAPLGAELRQETDELLHQATQMVPTSQVHP